VSPQKARTEKQVLDLKRDNWDGKEHWMLVDETEVCITAQRTLESPTGQLRIPKRTFDRMVRFYLADQARPRLSGGKG
jgi:hypothetical protein